MKEMVVMELKFAIIVFALQGVNGAKIKESNEEKILVAMNTKRSVFAILWLRKQTAPKRKIIILNIICTRENAQKFIPLRVSPNSETPLRKAEASIIESPQATSNVLMSQSMETYPQKKMQGTIKAVMIIIERVFSRVDTGSDMKLLPSRLSVTKP